MTKMVHVYTPRRFQKTLDLEWIGPVVAEFQCPQDSRSPYHANGHVHYAPMGKWLWRCTSTGQVSTNLIWNESAQWLQSFGVGKIPGVLITPMACLLWPWRCTSTGQDGPNELDLERIGPVVAEVQHPQDSKSPYHAHGYAHYAPISRWP